MQLVPEMSDKIGPSVRNDGLGNTMKTHDSCKVQLGVLLSRIVGVH
jgi:hypothetical protein